MLPAGGLMLRQHQRNGSGDGYTPTQSLGPGSKTKAVHLLASRQSRPGSPLAYPAIEHGSHSQASGQSTPRDGINLEAWSRGLLGERQLENVGKVSEWVQAAMTAPSEAEGSQPRHSSPDEGDEDGDGESAGAEFSPTQRPKVSLPLAPITTSAALLSWLESLKESASVTSSFEAGSKAAASSHAEALSQIKAASERTADLLVQLEKARINVAELKAGSKAIEETSEELRDESEQKGGKMESLTQLVAELDSFLSYYSLLPTATAFLSEPNLSRVVLSDRFVYTLAQCDVGLKFVKNHPHFKEAAIYRLRFEHCITRGGSLAKLWACGKFKELATDAATRLKEREKNLKGKSPISLASSSEESNTTATVLLDFASPDMLGILYPRFSAAAPELRSVLSVIVSRIPHSLRPEGRSPAQPRMTKQRAVDQKEPLDEESMLADYTPEDSELQEDEHLAIEKNSEDYSGELNTFPEFLTLLSDCRNAYFEARRGLLAPIISTMLSRIEGRASAPSTSQVASPEPLKPDDRRKALHDSPKSPLLIFLSQALDLIKSVLISEYTLYAKTFGDIGDRDGMAALVEFLRSLSKDLFDRFHPRTYAETKLTALAKLATAVLDSVVLSGRSEQPRNDGNGATDCSAQSHKSDSPTDGYLLLSVKDPYDLSQVPQALKLRSDSEHSLCLLRPLIQPLYADISSRLVYRAKTVLHGRDVAQYVTSGSEILGLVKRMTQGSRSEMLRLSHIADEDGTQGRKRRGRSSVGVGVLEAAAKQALERKVSDSVTPSRLPEGPEIAKDCDIELFALPEGPVVATWYPSLTRAFKILSLLHRSLTRGEFAKLGVEAIECARGSILKGSEVLKGATKAHTARNEHDQSSGDRLDWALFVLRHALLLREMSASVDLSLLQLSAADRLDERLRATQSKWQPHTTLDASVVTKIMSGILEAVYDATKVFSFSAATANDRATPVGVERSATARNLGEDISRATSQVIGAVVEYCLESVFDDETILVLSSPLSRLEESLLPVLRRSRRRTALYVEDESLVFSVMMGVVQAIEMHLVGEGGGRIGKASLRLTAEDASQLMQRVAARMGLNVAR